MAAGVPILKDDVQIIKNRHPQPSGVCFSIANAAGVVKELKKRKKSAPALKAR
jgi:hypothetical protein